MNATISVPSGGGYFEGHFPGRPILPGVAELALVVDALGRHTGQAATLRAIRFARLRQVVGPGERLELTARAADNGHLRVDLRRDGTLVANGELALGHPETRAEIAASIAVASRPPHGTPPLDALLPHRPPMRFITGIVGEAADGFACAARIPSACALVAAGSAPALAGLEAAAQTAAIWEGMRRWREGDTSRARMGYLVALRDVIFFVDRIPADEVFSAAVRLDAVAPPLAHYAIEVAQGATLLLRGTIATLLTDECVD